MHRIRSPKGFTLIEVLVALVVLSLGLLGLASLQLLGLKNTNNAYYRTQASMFANNMVERIRANPGPYASTVAIPVCTSVPPSPYCARYGSTEAESCTSDDLRDYDLFVMTCGHLQDAATPIGGIQNLLPGGSLAITSGATPSVTVNWIEINDAGVDEARNVSVTIVP